MAVNAGFGASKAGRIFLSHSGDEAEAARGLAAALRDVGLDVWLDVERLAPGDEWQNEIAQAMQGAYAVAIYVGRSNVRGWLDFEIQVALDRHARDPSFRVIPVLGPGAEFETLPAFLKLFQCLDLRTTAERAHVSLFLERLAQTPSDYKPVLAADRAPFQGLFPFDVDDAMLFFGRERETEELVHGMQRGSFLAVVGNSGSGKSSLVRAGLIPALNRGRYHDGNGWVTSWRFAIARPGTDPFGELAESLPDLSMKDEGRAEMVANNRCLLREGVEGIRDVVAGSVPRGTRALLVVDQFEELFTSTLDKKTRERYVDSLLRLGKAGGDRPAHIVVVVRADFYGHCLEHAGLAREITTNQYSVRQVEQERLRDLIEKPLRLAGAQAEAGLTESLIDETGDASGNLSLLEYALEQLWERRSSGRAAQITHAAYQEMGRMRGALRNHANLVMGRLEHKQGREIAQRLLLEMTQLGEGTQDTRRRISYEEFLAREEDPAKARQVLNALVEGRLVTIGEQYAEIAHEALIRDWPELKAWIDQDRESIGQERRLQQAAEDWQRLNEDRTILMTGARLAEAERWRNASRRKLSKVGEEFLRRSRQSARRKRVRRYMFSALAALVLIPIILAVGLSMCMRSYIPGPMGTSVIEVEFSPDGHLLAFSDLSGRVEVWDISTRERRFIVRLTAPPHWGLPLPGAASLHFSPDNRFLVVSLNGTAQLWRVYDSKQMATFSHSGPNVAFSSDSRAMATVGLDQSVRVTDPEHRIEFAMFDHRFRVTGLAFGPADKDLITITADETAHMWNIKSRVLQAEFWIKGEPSSVVANTTSFRIVSVRAGVPEVRLWGTDHREQNQVLMNEGEAVMALSPDFRWLVSSVEGLIRVRDLRSAQRFGELRLQSAPEIYANQFFNRDIFLFADKKVLMGCFSPDSKKFSAITIAGVVRHWDIVNRVELSMFAPKFRPTKMAVLACSPDGNTVATAIDDGVVRIWNASNGRELARFERGL
jgi:WD40 repeat protein